MSFGIAYAGGDYNPLSTAGRFENTKYMLVQFLEMANKFSNIGVDLKVACDRRVISQAEITDEEVQRLCLPYDNVSDIFEEHKSVEWSLIWNGSSQKQLVNSLKSINCRVVFVELGVLPQNGNYLFDVIGANQDSELAMLKSFVPSRDIEFEKFRSMYLSLLPSTKPKTDFLKSYEERPIVFLPLQMETDSNIVRHSPYKKMNDFVNAASKAFGESIIVARPHPRQKNVSINCKSKNVIVTNEGSLGYWLDRCDIICGINSTVLIEALMYLKPVIAVGKGLGNNKSVFALEGENSLDNSISLGMKVDYESIRNFILEIIFRRQISLLNLSSREAVSENRALKSILLHNTK